MRATAPAQARLPVRMTARARDDRGIRRYIARSMEDCSYRSRPVLALVALGIAAWLAAGAGCTRPLPAHPSSAALYRDLERVVTVREAQGWEVDTLEINQILSATLMSTCQVEPAQRLAALQWIEQRIAAMGGPVEAAYLRRGRKLDGIEELLSLTRVRLALDRAISVAEADCPFWLPPQTVFRGRQISDGRWQVSLSGGGQANLVVTGGNADVQFGGASRALIGRVFDNSMGLYTGLELGGGASVPKNPDGTRSALILGVDLVAPVMVRYYWVNTFLDLEAGYMAHATEEDWRDIDHGFHVGVYVAGRATRVRWFFPAAGIGLAYERTFPDGVGEEPLHLIKAGFRGAFDFDL